MQKARKFPFLTVLVLVAVLPPARAQVRVWQGTLTLSTCEEGAPDPNPPFDAFATGRFNYPYTLRENLTNEPVPHDWRAVYLENEYLKCSVLPDIGGHLYTCIDKLSGQAMFYANPSIKNAAFGIEFNFPVSPSWVSMSPVPYSFGKHPDGSASVWVGNIDRVYGMEWQVELRLRPGSTVLEERVTLNNRSDVRHRFSWWDNATIEVKDNSRSIGAEFVHGSREPVMGVWRTDTNSGTGHYAQAGLFADQGTYTFLQPREIVRFSEYWMPARGIGGIARANLAGVLNLTRRDGALVAAFNANRKIAGASIRIL
jgi:hypothetical protein